MAKYTHLILLAMVLMAVVATCEGGDIFKKFHKFTKLGKLGKPGMLMPMVGFHKAAFLAKPAFFGKAKFLGKAKMLGLKKLMPLKFLKMLKKKMLKG